MNWNSIPGQENVKKQLQESIALNRIGHAQLFVGREGYGTLPLALAYVKEILKGENEAASHRVETLNHVDVQFSFPVFKEKNVGLSNRFFQEFREKVLENPFFGPEEWNAVLDSENKQLSIYADEIDEINQKFALKSFEGGTKVLIMWGADKMNASASNKLLKFLEEPPAKTLIILLAENDQDILPTILSRTQIVKVPPMEDEDIETYLAEQFSLDESRRKAVVFQAQGDLNSAMKLATTSDAETEFETLFVQWVREAFQVKTKPEMLKNIIVWARNIAAWNREKQKHFLEYCAEMFRLALMQNYGLNELVYRQINMNKFNWEAFSKFIHGANIEDILEEISGAEYHLQRNANFQNCLDGYGASKLSRYIHRKNA